MNKKMSIKEAMKEFGISYEELLADIEEQSHYTYSHRVKYKNYIIAQEILSTYNDIIILRNNKEIFHATCDRQFTDEELKEKLINFIGDPYV